VKGRQTEFMIYELLALRASDHPDLRIRDRDEQLSEMTWQASQNFEAGDFSAAERAYRAILEVFPDDSLARFMIAECMERQGADLADAASESSRDQHANLSVVPHGFRRGCPTSGS
jgi:Tfp pilus assembly protein PilF